LPEGLPEPYSGSLSMQNSLILTLLVFVLSFGQLSAADQPNVVIVIGDDCTFSDLPLYGGENVATPNIDQLAAEGVTFNHAYLAMAMCQPCRAELYSGLYPYRNGCTWNHSASRPETRSVPHYFGELGYRVAITGKTHIVPKEAYPFEIVHGFEPGCVKQTAAGDCSGIREFMSEAGDQPFFLVVGLVSPHVPWTVGDPSHFKRPKLRLPPFLVDTPETRDSFARYLAEIEVMDQQVGDVMRTVEETGHAEDTIFIFTSEQGAQFPGCKWTNWDQGLHTAMVARWPGQVTAGTRTDALVQYADVLPTLLDAAGAKVDPANFDGSSFLAVLKGEAEEHREFVYGMHNNVPEGPGYPIRSVANRDYRYIENLTPDALYIEKHIAGKHEHNPYYSSWWFRSGQDPHAYAMLHRYSSRPPVELYKRSEDPFELKNVVDDPEMAVVKDQLAAELARWMGEQGDPGAELDTKEALQHARSGFPNQ